MGIVISILWVIAVWYSAVDLHAVSEWIEKKYPNKSDTIIAYLFFPIVISSTFMQGVEEIMLTMGGNNNEKISNNPKD